MMRQVSSAFADVEQFLADFQEDPGDGEAYEEDEVREILAVTWQERRKTLNRLQKARKFQEAGQVRRQFRVEVEELKKKTRCHKCLQTGHWARECRNPSVKGQGKGSKGSASSLCGRFCGYGDLSCHDVAEVEATSQPGCFQMPTSEKLHRRARISAT